MIFAKAKTVNTMPTYCNHAQHGWAKRASSVRILLSALAWLACVPQENQAQTISPHSSSVANPEQVASAGPLASADRVLCYYPINASGTATDPVEVPQAVTPDVAQGITDQQAWAKYARLWKEHATAPENSRLRRLLGLPPSKGVDPVTRKGVRAPSFLPWKPGSFETVTTPHFEILSRADSETNARIATDLERGYWIWTQVYFPFWKFSQGMGRVLHDWDVNESWETFSAKIPATMVCPTGPRHRVVLEKDESTLKSLLVSPKISAGSAQTIAQATGFYSERLRTTILSGDGDAATRRHEMAHQLFREATNNRLSRRNLDAGDSFWLLEGIAGHFESLRLGTNWATLGGWDASRLQHARHRVLAVGQTIGLRQDIQGDRRRVQSKSDLAAWYAGAILHTHYLMDGNGFRDRGDVMRMLADLYQVNLSFTETTPRDVSHNELRDFLLLRDQSIPASGLITSNANQPRDLCLTRCPISRDGVHRLGSVGQLRWLDVSGLPIEDATLKHLVATPTTLRHLNIEATQITNELLPWLAQASTIEEIDLSGTIVDDALAETIRELPQLQTVWLTGSRVGDATLNAIAELPSLHQVDVQKTAVSQSALAAFRKRRPEVELNPLQLAP